MLQGKGATVSSIKLHPPPVVYYVRYECCPTVPHLSFFLLSTMLSVPPLPFDFPPDYEAVRMGAVLPSTGGRH